MLTKIFLAALAIRWAYALLIFTFMGAAGLQGVDSIGYLANAVAFSQSLSQGTLHGFDWLGNNPAVMPLFAWLMAINALLFKMLAPLSYVLIQGIFDAGTCLLIYSLAKTLHPRLAVPAAILSILNPTQIVLSGYVYNDTIFLFFVVLFLWAAARWLQAPSWRLALLLGLGLGLANLVRIIAAPWAPALLLFLLAAAATRGRATRTAVAQLMSAAMIVAVCIAPILWRNLSNYGAWSLTPQGGQHLALWVVPLVREASDGTPWIKTFTQMQQREHDRFPTPAANLFDDSNRYRQIAIEALGGLGAPAIAKAWLTGAAINLASPAASLSPPVSQMPRTGFYETVGASPIGKIWNFLFHSGNRLYAWIILISSGGVLIMRGLQIAGLVILVRTGGNVPALALFILWTAYVLAVNGPIASPKYRLPIEPVLVVLGAAGLSPLLERRRMKKSTQAIA